MTDCDRKTIFGRPACRFEARFDLGEPDAAILDLGYRYADPFYSDNLAQALDATKQKTYVRDVCIRCGRTIERQKP